MCGPLCGASCAGRGRTTLALLRYQLGRTLGYGFAGALAGSLGHGLSGRLHGASAAPLTSIAMSSALVMLSWRAWRSAADTGVVQLRVGPRPARDPQTGTPTRSLFSTLGRLAPREPAVAGLLSALLPCGALAAGLLLAATTGERTAGAVAMMAFAGASALGVLSGGWLLSRMTRLRGRLWPRTIAVALAVLALLAGLRPLYQAAAAQDPAVPAAVVAPACH